MENYDILRLIGTGSYGEVHLVRDRRNGKKVSIVLSLLYHAHTQELVTFSFCILSLSLFSKKFVLKKIELENASTREKEFAKREVCVQECL